MDLGLTCLAPAVQAKQAERDATTARMEVEALGDAYQKVRAALGAPCTWGACICCHDVLQHCAPAAPSGGQPECPSLPASYHEPHL